MRMLIGWVLAFRSGHTCAFWCAMGDHGAYARKGRRAFHRDHGLVRPSRPRYGDARQRGERGKRVHGPIRPRIGESTLPHLVLKHDIDDELIHAVDLQVGRLENAIGWYHSHPGYGCWLSGIDVNTQMNNQKFTDPFVAVVVRFIILSPPRLLCAILMTCGTD